MAMEKTTERKVMNALAAKVRRITDGTDKPSKAAPAQMIDVSLRKAIRGSGLTHYAIGKAAGVAPSQLDRFMMPDDDPRHRDLRLGTAAKVAAALGLRLTAD